MHNTHTTLLTPASLLSVIIPFVYTWGKRGKSQVKSFAQSHRVSPTPAGTGACCEIVLAEPQTCELEEQPKICY